ncbi:hypothetical protein TPEKDK363_0896 [Treponema pallidum subsp. pertenue]|nr:hypothetical protein TPEKDK363_0896 [Treponema pallidum subsp. pertenue]AYE91252.1 hypothetical protein TPESGK403_0896 [Treponema pallidum subsp. pertenue]
MSLDLVGMYGSFLSEGANLRPFGRYAKIPRTGSHMTRYVEFLRRRISGRA